MSDTLQIDFIENNIQADFIENNISISFSENNIQVDFVENNLNVDFTEDVINISVESAIVNYTGASIKWYDDIFILTATDINNKFVFLTNTPLPNSVKLNVRSAPDLIKTIDYIVSGSTLMWAGYNLENFLAVNDVIMCNYAYQ